MMIQNSKTILLVEDDKEIQFVLSEYLSEEGYKVLVADNGLVGLELIQEQGMPNIILLDMMMPVMNGNQFGLEFMASYNNLCPILVMSAAMDVEQRAKEIEAVAYIVKPFLIDKILEMVKMHEKYSCS